MRKDGKEKKKHSVRFKIIISCASVIGILLITVGVYGWHLLSRYNYKDFSKESVEYQDEEFDKTNDGDDYESADPDSVIWGKYGDIKDVEGVTNILLCAEENQFGAKRGRADVIIIATIDTNTNKLKLTSILRDTYVQIPGFSDNRINSSYKTGDIPLLEETIEKNFNIKVDAYVKVDFESFTKVIDALGGVPIDVTADEAAWLNKSNHILDENSRDVKAGLQKLNGSQALGYSRIRKVRTADGLGSDFGRVWRQKHVMMQVFDQYKSKGILEILRIAPDILQLVQTDLSKTEMLSLVKTVMDLNVNTIDTMAVPVKNGYEPKKINGMDVLVPNLQVNNDAINHFMYGTDSVMDADVNQNKTLCE